MSDDLKQFSAFTDHEGKAFTLPPAADGMALALSGGGYKAAAYHLGALIRLNELGLLPKLKRISSVSGGSIAAGLLGLVWSELAFDGNGQATNFDEKFVDPLKDFLTEVNVDIPEILAGLALPFRTGADGLTKAYEKHLLGKASLQALPDEAAAPRFVFLATNYETNSLWRFSRKYAADYRVGRIDQPNFRLAQIVAASSGFPPFFCPLKLSFEGQNVIKQGTEDLHYPPFTERAELADGGIYDNMGLEPIWKSYKTLLVSNAGDPMDANSDAPTDWPRMLRRVMGMVHRQAENNRVRWLMDMAATGQRKLVYWPLRNSNAQYPVQSPLNLAPKDIASAQAEEVRLWSLGAKGFRNLVNHGYVNTDAATRSYLPIDPIPPSTLPNL